MQYSTQLDCRCTGTYVVDYGTFTYTSILGQSCDMSRTYMHMHKIMHTIVQWAWLMGVAMMANKYTLFVMLAGRAT